MIEVTAERMAHGGSAVGRVDGQVVFVRGAIPGETVRAEVVRTGRRGRFLEAETVEVLQPSPDRVRPPCPLAYVCGGCDWQHIAVPRQRQLKAEVLADQLHRLGGVDVPVTVDPAGDRAGLGWRTRMRFAATPRGRWGLRRERSHEVVTVDSCPIATADLDRALSGAPTAHPSQELVAASQDHGAVLQVLPDGRPATVTHTVAGRTWQMPATGFWQAHVNAPTLLSSAVAPHVREAARWWDLYCGVGLFAGTLAAPGQTVTAVEGDRAAAATARTCLADLPDVRVVRADVRSWLSQPAPDRPDVVVLDPPRAGAGAAVCSFLSGTAAHRLVYVSCDPAALARDTRTLIEAGWGLSSVAGIDLFPMSHHVESIAVFDR